MCVGFYPTTAHLKNSVLSYQALCVNPDTNDGSYNVHELIHDSEEYFSGSFMDDSSLFEERSIPSKKAISVIVQSISLLEGTLLHECKVPQRCDLQGTYNEFLLMYLSVVAWISSVLAPIHKLVGALNSGQLVST